MKNITNTSTPVKSRITEATVYLSGAQITRKCSVPAAQGVQTYIFEKLPGGLQAESIQVSAEEGILIRSVEHAVNYMQTVDYSAEIVTLQKKLNKLDRDCEYENTQIELGQLEENMFEHNMKLAGAESGLKADELKAAVLFYNERMAAVREARRASNLKLEELRKEMNALRSQLGEYNDIDSEPVSEITVTVVVDSDAAGKEITLSYFVYNASWKPSYDIRVKDVNGKVALHYKANVSQNSGENWDEVKLTLSTGNPSANGACPNLNPWYLDFYSEPKLSRLKAFNAMPSKQAAEFEMTKECEQQEIYEEQIFEEIAVPAVTMAESVTSVEYNITAPYTIASGDGGQDVEITVHLLPAEYRYFSVRKLEREVFLLAAVSGWEHLNLIAGEASIFFENRYVGKSYIDPRRADEKIDLSLGADQSVIVTRVRGKDFTARTFTGGSVKQTRQWELTARNLKTVPVEIEMLDQVPVSTNKQITIDVLEISNAEMNKETGILTWKFTLEPAKSKSAAVKYVVTNPKNTTVYLD